MYSLQNTGFNSLLDISLHREHEDIVSYWSSLVNHPVWKNTLLPSVWIAIICFPISNPQTALINFYYFYMLIKQNKQEKDFQLCCIELFSVLVKRENILHKTRCIYAYKTKSSKIQCSVSEAACSSDLSEAEGPTSSNSQSGLVHGILFKQCSEKICITSLTGN